MQSGYPTLCLSALIIHLQRTTRQQTTAVDYKRLFNGFFLTDVVSLRYDVKRNRYGKENNKRQNTRGGCKLQPV